MASKENEDEDNQSNDNDDYEEGEEGEVEEDDEVTLDEEDDLNGDEDYEEELKGLAEENELSVEELRRKYYGEIPDPEEEKNVKNGDNEGEKERNEKDIEETQQATSSTLTRNMHGKMLSAALNTATSETITKYFKAEDLEEDDSEDYMPPEIWKKEIRVGPEFQVTKIPEVPSNPKNDYLDISQPLWIAVPERCLEEKVTEYLVECERIRAGEKVKNQKKRAKTSSAAETTNKSNEIVPDDENALLALYQADYDLNKAKSRAPFDFPALCSVNGPKRTQSLKKWRAWSEVECANFEKGIMEYGKNFWKIQRDFLPDRKLGEIVCFYYSWKKTEKHDIWRAEKNKRDQQVDVKTADLMGQITESILQHGNKSQEAGISKKGTATV